MKWSDEHQIHILTVLHQNKGSNEARGHIGTELNNKSETVLSVEKKNETTSMVESVMMRDRDISPIAFSVDDNGLPFFNKDYKIQSSEANKRIICPTKIDDLTHKEVLKFIFKDKDHISHSDLKSVIINEFSKGGKTFGESKSRLFITHYKTKGWVINKDRKNFLGDLSS